MSSDVSVDEDYKSRWRSIRVMYFTMFLSSVGKDAEESKRCMHVQPCPPYLRRLLLIIMFLFRIYHCHHITVALSATGVSDLRLC